MPRQVGVIGLGNIGEPMAARIAGAGFDLTVFDTRREPLDAMRKLGVKVASSVAAVGQACDIIELVVFDDDQVEQIIVGEGMDGLLAHARPGSIIVIHSTVRPQTSQRLGKIVRERGLHLLDAPVSGMDIGARAGTLTVMVGGDADQLEICRPVFQSFARNIFHLGDLGAGQVAKLANNLMIGVNMLGVQEALAMAQKAGIDLNTMIDVISVSSGDSWALRNFAHIAELRREKIGGVKGQHDAGLKDFSLILEAGKSYGVPVKCAEFVLQAHQELIQSHKP